VRRSTREIGGTRSCYENARGTLLASYLAMSTYFIRALALVALPFVAALFVAACSGSTLSTGGPSASTACADSGAAYCAQLAKCSPVSMAEDYASMATCTSRRTQLCENSLAAPGTGATPETTEACVAAYPTYSCADFDNDVVPPAFLRRSAYRPFVRLPRARAVGPANRRPAVVAPAPRATVPRGCIARRAHRLAWHTER